MNYFYKKVGAKYQVGHQMSTTSSFVKDSEFSRIGHALRRVSFLNGGQPFFLDSEVPKPPPTP